MILWMRHDAARWSSMLTRMCVVAVCSNNSTIRQCFCCPNYLIVCRLACGRYLCWPIPVMSMMILSFAMESRKTIAHVSPAIFPALLVLWLRANLVCWQLPKSEHPGKWFNCIQINNPQHEYASKILHDSLNIWPFASTPFWLLPYVQHRLNLLQKRSHRYICHIKKQTMIWVVSVCSWFIPIRICTLYSYAKAVAIFLVHQHPKREIERLLLCPMLLEPNLNANISFIRFIRKACIACYIDFASCNIFQLTFSQLNPMVVTVFKYWSNLRRYNAVVLPAESKPSIAICNVP